jgi:serine/threonine-protein kinase
VPAWGARLERAWCAWRPGDPPPRWDDFLPAQGEPFSPDAACYLAQVDIEFRIKAGLPALLVERYFQHPRLEQADAQLDDARQVELIRWEYQQRWKNGERPRRADYLAAFPRHALALAALRPNWICPVCRHKGIAHEDETAPTMRCPRCGIAFPLTVVFPPSHRPADSSPDTLPSGLDSRNYDLLEQLGAGGMGEVYRARDPGLGRDLAVKVMRPSLRDDPEAESRFLREARVTGALQHPDIVPVHNLGRLPDGRLYFTMKLVRGQTLEDILTDGSTQESRQQRLPERLAIFEKVCQAVAYAHSKGVIHRDLKPGNIMVGAFGEVQVMDWGLAKRLEYSDCRLQNEESVCGDERSDNLQSSTEQHRWDGETQIGLEGPAGEADLSRAGRALGTPAFMPPEQASGRMELVDERADVFSLGAILCVLLTGRPPYLPCEFRQEVLIQAQRGDLAEAMGWLNTCGADPELIRMCQECLSVQREDRPRDGGVVAERLAAYQAGVQQRLRQAELERAQGEVKTAEARKRQKVHLALAGTLLLLLLVGGGVGWVWQQQQQKVDGAATSAMDQARLLLAQARKSRLGDLGRFREALAAAQKAEELAGTGASESVRREALALATMLKEEADTAARDQVLLAALPEVRGPREGPQYVRSAEGQIIARVETADQQFARVFRDWGLDVDAVSTADAAARLRRRPAAVVTEVVAALDDWAGERRRQNAPGWRRPADLANALEARESKRSELQGILTRGRLPLEQPLGVLLAAMRPVPIPCVLPLEDGMRLRQLAARTDPAREPLLGLLTLAEALRQAGDDPGAERLLRAAVRVRPQEVMLQQKLGNLLTEQQPPRWREAVECYAAARALRPELGMFLADALIEGGQKAEGLALFEQLAKEKPDNPTLHYRRGYTLRKLGDVKGAIAAYTRVIEIETRNAGAHNNLGLALLLEKKVKEARFHIEKAIEIEPRDAQYRFNLGIALRVAGDLPGSIKAFQKAIDIEPRFARAHLDLGNTLYMNGEKSKAIDALRSALALDTGDARIHSNLGVVLYETGEYSEAHERLRRCLELYSANDRYRPTVLTFLLDAFQGGTGAPADPGILLEMAFQAQHPKLQRYVASARLYRDAFGRSPRTARNLGAGHRYNAACAVALAGCGKGKDIEQLDPADRPAWRRQALAWLRADLAVWSAQLQSQDDRLAKQVRKTLEHWRSDTDLAGVRDREALAKLPANEQAAWHKFWSEVDTLRSWKPGDR